MRVYVASSWRNTVQQTVVKALLEHGHEVYDFRHPAEGDEGFHWTAVEAAPHPWSGETLKRALEHPVAQKGYANDMGALVSCDACVLVLPCGRSAHLELGWAAGACKITVALMLAPDEPELMYSMLGRVATSIPEVLDYLHRQGQIDARLHGRAHRW